VCIVSIMSKSKTSRWGGSADLRAVFFRFLVICVLVVPVSYGQRVSDEERALRDELQDVYRSWAAAMRAKDYPVWAKCSTSWLKVEVENQIRSQKMQFPRALFESPMAAPQVARLRFVRAKAVGNEAQLMYFGRVELEEGGGGDMPENLLVIWFGKEQGTWRVGRVQVIDLDSLPIVRRNIKGFRYEALDQPELVVDGKVPATPKRAPKADYIAKLFAISLNEQAKISINGGASDHEFKANRSAQVVIGGLKRGKNTIRLDVSKLLGDDKPRDTVDDRAPFVVRLYLMPDEPQRQLPVIVWRYEPEDGKAPTEPITETFVVDDEMLQQRYRKLDE